MTDEGEESNDSPPDDDDQGAYNPHEGDDIVEDHASGEHEGRASERSIDPTDDSSSTAGNGPSDDPDDSQEEDGPANGLSTTHAADPPGNAATDTDEYDTETEGSSGGFHSNVRKDGDSDGPGGPPIPGGGEPSEDDTEVDGHVLLVRDVMTSVGAVALIGLYLFAISGVWPPMVAIESGSMEPNMNVNDLVFVMDTDRFQPDSSQDDTGVVPADRGSDLDYHQFGAPGDVIVYAPNGNTEQTPIIHRAMYWVEEGEDWVERADSSYLGGATSCEDLRHSCPAPHDGFITKGDNNMVYDQVQTNDPIKPEWIVGTAERRVPGIGWVRLRFQ